MLVVCSGCSDVGLGSALGRLSCRCFVECDFDVVISPIVTTSAWCRRWDVTVGANDILQWQDLGLVLVRDWCFCSYSRRVGSYGVEVEIYIWRLLNDGWYQRI